MKITLLGTGTSQGMPVIGCQCESCLSTDHRDNRLRSGVLVEDGETNILIDTGPDLRQQMLKHNIKHVDAIFYTHEHNDHMIGLDDIRPFNFMQRIDMPIYGLKRVLDDIKSRFSYIFKDNPYPGSPRAVCYPIDETKVIDFKEMDIVPVPIFHGNLPILGYRIGDFTFLTDISEMSNESKEIIKNTKVLVISALRKEKHHSHLTLSEAVELIAELNPEKAYITHVSHVMGPATVWERELPENVFPAYDGLEINL